MKAALTNIKSMMWYHWCCLIIPFVRIYPLSFGSDLIPKFVSDGYTYQDAWYYFWSRGLEAMLFFAAFKHTKSPVLLFPVVLSFFKIFDEKNTPFNFSVGEGIAWIIATLIAVAYSQNKNYFKIK